MKINQNKTIGPVDDGNVIFKGLKIDGPSEMDSERVKGNGGPTSGSKDVPGQSHQEIIEGEGSKVNSGWSCQDASKAERKTISRKESLWNGKMSFRMMKVLARKKGYPRELKKSTKSGKSSKSSGKLQKVVGKAKSRSGMISATGGNSVSAGISSRVREIGDQLGFVVGDQAEEEVHHQLLMTREKPGQSI